MTVLLILPLLLSNFVLKESIPYGTSGPNGRVLLGDFNRNNMTDIIFTGYSGTFSLGMIFERQDSGVYVLRDTVGFYLAVWDVGDFDSDGLYDLVTDGDDFIGIMIFESPDSFSYPTQEVWRDTVGPPLVLPISAYDIDQDGFFEIVKMGGDLDTAHYTDFLIYETINNNMYSVTYTIATETSPTSTVAFGDFDRDTLTEFAMGTIDGEYSIFESPADNTYESLILNQQLPTLNIKDCFSVPDADGDGKMEFVIKGFVIPTARIHAFIFEATGDNTYEIVKYFDFHAGDYYGGYSDAGDVDGDNIPEIVLEARQNVFIIKAAGNDSFYVWDTLPGNWGGSSVRVYDVDGNGLSDVIISGGNTTRIFEYELGINETQEVVVPKLGIKICPNPFRHTTSFSYQLPYNCSGSLQVYDVAGKLVRKFRLKLNALRRTLSWDGSDDHNRRLPSGVYFLKLQAKDYSTTEKLLLIR